MLKLRDYQTNGLAIGRQKLAAGIRRILFVAATGGGKTVCFAHITEGGIRKGSRVVVLAPRTEIIQQTYKKLIEAGLRPDDVGIQMGSVGTKRVIQHKNPWIAHARVRPHAPVQLGILASFARRKWLERNRVPDVLVIDEAHESVAPSYRAFIDECRRLNPNIVILGFTATPFLTSGEGFEDIYDDLVVIATPRYLATTIDPSTGSPYLMWPRVRVPPLNQIADVTGVKIDKKKGDFKEEALARASNQPALIGSIVTEWLAHANGVRTVLFAVNREHSKACRDRFLEAGVPAEHIDGDMTATERAGILERLESGETLVVTNCMTLIQGWDSPSVGCCILARRTKALWLGIQQMGRVLRPFPGKAQPLILDHAGFCLEFNGPMFERPYSLKARVGRDTPTAEMCKSMDFIPKGCGEVIDADWTVCAGCGWEVGAIYCPDCLDYRDEKIKILREDPGCPECDWEKPIRAPVSDVVETASQLVELNEYEAKDTPPLLAEYNRMKTEFEAENERLFQAGQRPKKRGALDEMFRASTGTAPPKGHKKAIVTKDQQALIEFHDEVRAKKKEDRAARRAAKKAATP